MPSTIERCLARLGLAIASLAGCDDLDAEWAAVKRAYFKTALKTHPDKGGDASAFRKVPSTRTRTRTRIRTGTRTRTRTLTLALALSLTRCRAPSRRCARRTTAGAPG